GGQTVQVARGLQVAGIEYALLRLTEQQLGFLPTRRLHTVMVTVSEETGEVLFQQRVALAEAEHLVAQHAVGGGGVLDAAGVGALVTAQRFHALLQRGQLVEGRHPGLVGLQQPGLPVPVKEPCGDGHGGRYQGNCKPAQQAPGRWRSGDFIHGGTASLAGMLPPAAVRRQGCQASMAAGRSGRKPLAYRYRARVGNSAAWAAAASCAGIGPAATRVCAKPCAVASCASRSLAVTSGAWRQRCSSVSGSCGRISSSASPLLTASTVGPGNACSRASVAELMASGTRS